MPTVNILTVGVRGVDMRANPLALGNERLRAATNMVFDEGVLKTRPGIAYHDLGITGQFQGVCAFAPSLGISAESFGPSLSALAVAAGGKVFIVDSTGGELGCQPQEITCEDPQFRCVGPVHLFQAENYLIAQSEASNTFWWDGSGCMEKSPGLAEDQYWEDPEPPKIVHVHVPAEAQNTCCDTYVCYDPGATSASCSGSFPDTQRPSTNGSTSGSTSTSASGGGGGGGSSNSSSSSSASSSSSSSASSSSSSSASCSWIFSSAIIYDSMNAAFNIENTGGVDVTVTAVSLPVGFLFAPSLPVVIGVGVAQTFALSSGDFEGETITVTTDCGTQNLTF